MKYLGSAEKVKGRHKIRFIGNKRLFSEGFVVDKPLISAFSSKNFQSENRSARVLKVLCQKPCASIIKILLKHKLDQRFVLFQQTLFTSDDGSIDPTLSVISTCYNERVKRVREVSENSDEIFGNSISKATGDYIFPGDQNNVWFNNKVHLYWKLLNTRSDCC